MPLETKPMVKSASLWGLLGVAIPFIGEALKYVGTLPPGTLPLPVMYAIGVAGWGLAVYRKLYGDNKPIEGILVSPKKGDI